VSGEFPPPDAPLEDPVAGDLFASALWFGLAARAALPAGVQARAAAAEGVWLALREAGPRRDALTTPYTQAWAPLGAPGADFRSGGAALGALWRGRPPGRLELLDPAHPGLDAFLAGLGAAGLALRRYDHMAQWHEALPEGIGWSGYLAARPPALRNTLRRKRARAGRFALLGTPGAALDAGIAAFEAVRARSWKPEEPFPGFDAALMRALAPLGTLRLGLLFIGDEPVAAQYWVLDRGGRRALVPKLFHDEAHKGASPGTVLTAMMVEHLLEEDGVRELDFGRGDDGYKGLWVSHRRQRIGVMVADPRHPAGLAALVRHGAGRLRARLLGR
jgi:hypothetical protein